MEQNRTITVDNVEYAVAQFSQEVQQAVSIYNAISLDLQKAQLEAMKCQAALQTVGSQITQAVKAELAAKAEATPAAE